MFSDTRYGQLARTAIAKVRNIILDLQYVDENGARKVK